MKRRFVKSGRLVLEIVIGLLALVLMVIQVNRDQMKMEVRMTFRVLADQNDVFELDLDGRRIKARVTAGDDYQDITFTLPHQPVSKMRLHLGHQVSKVGISNIRIRTILESYSLPAEKMRQVFNYQYHILDAAVENGRYQILISGDDPFLGISRTIPAVIRKLSERKWFFYVIMLMLSVMLVCFLHGLDFQNLRVFFSFRIFGNFVFLFIIAIFFPLLNSVFHAVKPLAIQERRQLAGRPALRLDVLPDFFADYQRYYNDHFVWRTHLIKANSLISYSLFKKSSTPLVTIGKQGWLFMAEEDPKRNETVYFRSVDLFDSAELENWTQSLEQRRMWLASMGIQYLFVVAPNKSTIYPEFMPDRFRKMHAVSRLDQLLEHLRLHSKVNILDLRTALMKAKKAYPVYYKTDSHWNDYGGYWAYREIMEYIAEYYPMEKPFPSSDFDIIPIDRAGGDLAQALALEKNILREKNIKMEPRIPFKARTVSRINLSPYVTKSESRCPSGRLPTAVMVHDSFVHELRPFLAQHFSRMVWIWDWGLNIYPDIIRKEKPWLVIDEMAERYLMDKKLANPQEVSAGSGYRRENR